MKNLYNLINFKFLKNSIKVNTIINYFDYFLFTIVIFTFLADIIDLLSYINNSLIEFFNINGLDLIHNMSENKSISNTNTTTTTIIHDDGSWSNAIRTLFIYGTGGYRLNLLRGGGTPSSRAFVIGSTIAGDALAKVINNTINDPTYVKSHYFNWRSLWKNINDGEATVEVDAETIQKLTNATTNKFISGGDSLGSFSEELINGIFIRLKSILEPVQANYSNEILSNQIYDLSIILFIFSLIIFGLIVVLLLNIILYINMDRIIKFFKNKYIVWYLVVNKKFLSIEIFILGGTILLFMSSLITGIRFIATHPIIIN